MNQAPFTVRSLSEVPARRAHALRRAGMVGLMALVLVSFAMAHLQSLIWMTSDWMVSTILPAVIVSETNEERRDDALPPLVRNPILDAAATMKAEHMAANQYFAHFSPDGISPWYWFEQSGYSFVHAGENLAIYFTDSSEVVDAWMNSPTHRANILDAQYREIGLGVAEGEFEGYDTIYVVQLFGTPAAAIVNESVSREIVASESVADADVRASVPPQVAGISDRETISSADTTQVGMANDETLMMYSGHAATTTGKIEAPVMGSVENREPPSVFKYATQPKVVLQTIYILIACFVFTMLLMSIRIDLKREQTMEALYSIALLALMFALFEVQGIVAGTVMVG